MPVKCPDCGFLYIPSDSNEEAAHGEYHKDFMAPDNAKPDPKIANLANEASGLVIFQRSDPDFLHKILYGIARRFKKEMGYDSADWAETGHQVPSGAIGALFADVEGRALGGAGIYTETQFSDVSHMIGWIWVVPKYRKKGILARAMPDLAARFPGALFQFPYSPAMEHFASKSPFITDEPPYYLKTSKFNATQ